MLAFGRNLQAGGVNMKHSHSQFMSRQKTSGFTLIEMVIVIVLIGIVTTAIGPLIGNKFNAVAQSTDRARWVQQAEFALFHIRQDLANSVPNSIFTSEAIASQDQAFEMLTAPVTSAAFAARYRDRQFNPYDRLQTNNDISFDVFGSFASLPQYVSIGTAESIGATDMRSSWQSKGTGAGTIAEIDSLSVAVGENGSPITNITLTGTHNFGGHSPYYRAYFTDGPVAYFCSGGTLNRISGYTSLDPITTLPFRALTGIPETHRVTTEVVGCEFSVQGGSVFQPPMLKVSLSIGNATESIQLVDQIILGNGS